MLSGVGPTRAMRERVTHILYLAEIKDGQHVRMIAFEDLAERLYAAGVHHTLHVHEEAKFVSISWPFLPRNYVNVDAQEAAKKQFSGTAMPLHTTVEEEAKDNLIKLCLRHCVCQLNPPNGRDESE